MKKKKKWANAKGGGRIKGKISVLVEDRVSYTRSTPNRRGGNPRNAPQEGIG